MIDPLMIKKAAELYGFNLEFRTKTVLEENDFSTVLNKSYNLGDKQTEIDLVAQDGLDLHLVIECKGTTKGSCLLLVKEATPSKNTTNSSNTRLNIDASDYKIPLFQQNGDLCTFTGDFFSTDTKKLKKASKDDSQNNFYKAQLQLIEAVLAYSSESIENPYDDQRTDYIIPGIVTNAEIWTINYNQVDPECIKYKWIFHRLRTSKVNSNVTEIPIPIVNINHLKEFLSSLKNCNRQKWIIENVKDEE